MEAEIFPSSSGTGVAYLTNRDNFVVMNNYKNARVKRYAKLGDTAPITAWTVISSATQKPTEILCAKGSALYLVDGAEVVPVSLEFSSVAGANGSITALSVSLNGLHAAVLTDSGVLWLGGADFKNKYCEHAAGLRTKPRQMVW